MLFHYTSTSCAEKIIKKWRYDSMIREKGKSVFFTELAPNSSHIDILINNFGPNYFTKYTEKCECWLAVNKTDLLHLQIINENRYAFERSIIRHNGDIYLKGKMFFFVISTSKCDDKSSLFRYFKKIIWLWRWLSGTKENVLSSIQATDGFTFRHNSN